MNFLEAIKTGRPIRRASWFTDSGIREQAEAQGMPIAEVLFPKPSIDVKKMLRESAWLVCRIIVQQDGESAWMWTYTGRFATLRTIDYLADDWEVMP